MVIVNRSLTMIINCNEEVNLNCVAIGVTFALNEQTTLQLVDDVDVYDHDMCMVR
jgi:hypothetical protein